MSALNNVWGASLFNSVLPTKVYGIWNGEGRHERNKLGTVTADTVAAAFAEGKRLWGAACRSAIWEGHTGRPTSEPMFL